MTAPKASEGNGKRPKSESVALQLRLTRHPKSTRRGNSNTYMSINKKGNPNIKLKSENIKVIQVEILKANSTTSREPLTHFLTKGSI
jgi:hypothetical protein